MPICIEMRVQMFTTNFPLSLTIPIYRTFMIVKPFPKWRHGVTHILFLAFFTGFTGCLFNYL